MSLTWNPPPEPPQSRLADDMFKGDRQVAVWRQRRGLTGGQPWRLPATTTGQLHDEPSTEGLSQNALLYIMREVERRRLNHDELAGKLHDAMVKYPLQLSQPTVAGGVEALAHIWAQPEMLDFWRQWRSSRPVTARGPKPADAGGKAVLATLGMTKATHALDAYADVFEKPELLRVFARVDHAAQVADGENPRPLRLSTYRGSTERFGPLTRSAEFHDLTMRTNAAMFRALCELYPERRFGQTLLIDGCLFPAWCPQVGVGKTDESELRRRRTTPNAGARLIEYTRKGKLDLAPDAQRTAGRLVTSSKFARGYVYVCIVDQASGWPLVSTLMDAQHDEAEALVPLLSDLYRYYPFIAPKVIAGDGAWDEAWAHRLCELFYGLAPVFRHTERSAASTTVPGGNQSNTVAGFSHAGQLRCMAHKRPMPFDGFQRAPRGDLRPGQGAHGDPDNDAYRRELAQRENAFRVRALHRHGPGEAQRVGLKAALDWRRLNQFPRYPDGSPELYAERQALMMRLRNQMEGHFSRMQGSLSLLTTDADRVRLQDDDKLAALLRLAELRMNALSLAAERGHCGAGHTLPADGAVAPLPAFPYGRNGRLAECRAGGPEAARERAAARTRTAAPAPRRHHVASALTAPAAASASATEMEAAMAVRFAESADHDNAGDLDGDSVPSLAPNGRVPASGRAAQQSSAAPSVDDAPLAADDEQPPADVIVVDFRARRRA